MVTADIIIYEIVDGTCILSEVSRLRRSQLPHVAFQISPYQTSFLLASFELTKSASVWEPKAGFIFLHVGESGTGEPFERRRMCGCPGEGMSAAAAAAAVWVWVVGK